MWSKVGIGGEHHRYYKHTKFRQNPRGDPKFPVDLTRNDPNAGVSELELNESLPIMVLVTATALVAIVWYRMSN